MSAIRQFQTNGAGANTNASATRFGGAVQQLSNTGSSTESFVQLQCRTTGTYSQLQARSIVTPTATCTVNFRVAAGTNGNGTVAITAAGEFTDETHTDSVTGGTTKINHAFVAGATTQASITATGDTFAAGSNTVTRFGGYFGAAAPASSTTVYLMCGSGTSTTEADAQFKIEIAATLQNFQTNFGSAPANAATVRMRVGGANVNETVSVTTAAIVEDTSNTDSVSAGNLINFSWATGAGSVGTMRLTTVEVSTTTSSWLLGGGNAGGVTQNASLTQYIPICGDIASNATEGNVKVLADIAFTISFLGISVKTNTVSATSTFNMRKNAGAANGVASISSSTTGYIEDSTNTDAIVSTDEMNYSLVTGGSGTSLIYVVTGAKVAQTATGGRGRSLIMGSGK